MAGATDGEKMVYTCVGAAGVVHGINGGLLSLFARSLFCK